MGYDKFRISISELENGFEVEVPDMEAVAARKKENEKLAKAKGSTAMPSAYYGDCVKCYAAKSVAEVIKLVRGSLEKMPSQDYKAAFAEAASEDD